MIDAFRLISPQTMMLGQEPRQTTSNLGHLNKPSIQALIHGLNRHYYSIAINFRCWGAAAAVLRAARHCPGERMACFNTGGVARCCMA